MSTDVPTFAPSFHWLVDLKTLNFNIGDNSKRSEREGYFQDGQVAGRSCRTQEQGEPTTGFPLDALHVTLHWVSALLLQVAQQAESQNADIIAQIHVQTAAVLQAEQEVQEIHVKEEATRAAATSRN